MNCVLRVIDTVADTLQLRKLFRKLVTRDLPLKFSYLASGATEELYLGISTKVSKLQELMSKSEFNWTSLAPRVLSNVWHLRGRLQHLTKAGLCSTISENLCVQELQAQLNHIEQLAHSMSKGGDTTGQFPSIQMGKTTTDTDVAGSSSQMGDLHYIPSTGDVRSNHFSEAVVFTSNHFRKLCHPLSSLLKELPTVDGNDAEALCEFLSKVIQISKVGQVKVPFLYELLYPYCRGILLESLRQALTNRESFDLFHARLLQRFIPRRQLDQLRFEMYERLQEEGELLDVYVNAIKNAALVLRINDSEAELVARIVERFTSNQRNRLIFQSRPSTFEQLEQLAAEDRNISFVDNYRKSRVAGTTTNAAQRQQGHGPTHYRTDMVNNSQLPGKEMYILTAERQVIYNDIAFCGLLNL